MTSTTFVLFSFLVLFGACKGRKKSEDVERKDSGLASAPSALASSFLFDAGTVDASVESDASVTSKPALSQDSSTCALELPPTEIPFRGGVSFLATEGKENSISLLFNNHGVPLRAPIWPSAELASFLKRNSVSGANALVNWPPCVSTSQFVFCADTQGDVWKYKIGSLSEKGENITKALPGMRMAAVELDAKHTLLFYLSSRVSDVHGKITEAYAMVDDAPPLRVSENGSGASALAALRIGEKVLFLYSDVRSMMSPLHARWLSFENNKLVLGEDAILSVLGSNEVPFLSATSISEQAYALASFGNQEGMFGMNVFAVTDPPQTDISPVLSEYPGRVSFAPIASFLPRQKNKKYPYVLRARSGDQAETEASLLELGRLGTDSKFESFGIVDAYKSFRSISGIEASNDKIFLLYGDQEHMWLQSRRCPDQNKQVKKQNASVKKVF